MKKTLTCVVIASIATATAVALEWSADDNLAQNTTVTVSSKPADATFITDNNNGSSWQAYPQSHSMTNDWAIIDLGEVKNFNTIETMWEASHASKYSIYTSNEAIPYSSEEMEGIGTVNIIDADWLSTATPFSVRTLEGETSITDLVEKNGTGRYVLIYANEYNGWANTYGIRLFEVRIGQFANLAAVDHITVSDAEAIVGQTAIVNIKAINGRGEEITLDNISDLTLKCSDPAAVEISGGENGEYTVKTLKVGIFTLTAEAKAGEKTLSASAKLNIAYDWTSATTADLSNAIIYGRVKEDTEAPNLPKNAIDGNDETYYEYNGDWGGGDGWLLVDLGKEYVIKAFGASFANNSDGKMVFAYAQTLSDESLTLLADEDLVWQNRDKNAADWTESPVIDKKANSISTYIPEQPFTARYLVIRDTDNPKGKPQVKELLVDGEIQQSSIATTISIKSAHNYLVTNETSELSATVFDQYGVVMPDAEVTFSCSNAEATIENNVFSATTLGSYNIVAMHGDVESEPLEIHVIASEESKLTPDYFATFDGETLNADVLANGHTNWDLNKALEIDLDMEYNLNLIKVRWEAACPSDYTITATDSKGNTVEIFKVEGREFQGGFSPVDRVVNIGEFHHSMMRVNASNVTSLSNIKKLTIVPTAKKGHNYPIWLYGIDLYGEESSGTDSIEEIEVKTAAKDVCFDLQGRRVMNPVRGIFIINGKKVIR